ncbi:MAG: DUF3800 domain-containing protein [Alphaproteobacteria bacterium]
MTQKYVLYFDDTGSRDPDRVSDVRSDGMDCFGLGGVLVKEEDIPEVLAKHKAFCQRWDIDYALHSSRIRGGQGKFGWLRKPENAGLFMPDLDQFLLSLPVVVVACVVDRPGYVSRYKEQHGDGLWFMCRTAFCILAERSAKFADRHGRKLEIFYEQTGKKEDGDIVSYLRSLKREGCPFDGRNAGGYVPLTQEDYKRIILGEPRRKTKKVPMIQIADLMLYPVAKGGYAPDYPPYRRLRETGKLIDCLLPADDVSSCGIKYSCFERVADKIKGSV